MRAHALLAGLILIFCSAEVVELSAQTETTPAQKFYDRALTQIDRASRLERRGKKRAAIDAYEYGARLAEASIAEAERVLLPDAERPPEVYFRCAASFLHAGRLLDALKEQDRRKDEDLAKAVQYLNRVEQIERARAEHTQTPINPEIWRVRNAAGYAFFLRGELAQARLEYGAVLELNPSYKPAEKAIAEINRLEQQDNELFTPQGRTLQKEKNRKVLRGMVEALRLVRDIVTLGR